MAIFLVLYLEQFGLMDFHSLSLNVMWYPAPSHTLAFNNPKGVEVLVTQKNSPY
jgi:hypothetical protein